MNTYYYFKNVFSDLFCDEVIKYGNSQNEILARTGGTEDKKLNKKEKKQLLKKEIQMFLGWIKNGFTEK